MSLQHGSRWYHEPGTYSKSNFGTSRTPRIIINAASSGLNDTDTSQRFQRVWINGSQVMTGGTPRSYRITKLRQNNGQWSYIGTATYDAYGSVVQAQAMAADLLTWLDGEILILSTQDEPNGNRGEFMGILRDDFNSQIHSFPRDYRDSHLLIAVKGVGRIYEAHAPRYSQNGVRYAVYLL